MDRRAGLRDLAENSRIEHAVAGEPVARPAPDESGRGRRLCGIEIGNVPAVVDSTARSADGARNFAQQRRREHRHHAAAESDREWGFAVHAGRQPRTRGRQAQRSAEWPGGDFGAEPGSAASAAPRPLIISSNAAASAFRIADAKRSDIEGYAYIN